MYRKFKADNIFTGKEMLHGDHVLITKTGGEIVEITNEKNAGENIEILNGILSPGFINCHCHLELSHLKNKIPEHKGLVNFVEDVMSIRQEVTPPPLPLKGRNRCKKR